MNNQQELSPHQSAETKERRVFAAVIEFGSVVDKQDPFSDIFAKRLFNLVLQDEKKMTCFSNEKINDFVEAVQGVTEHIQNKVQPVVELPSVLKLLTSYPRYDS